MKTLILAIVLSAVSAFALPPWAVNADPRLVPASPSGPTNITSGLVAWWPLDETSGTSLADISGYGNTATLVGSPASITGVITNAWQFNGSSQYATVPYSASYDLSTFTLMCWINTTAYGGTVLSRNPYAAWEFCINVGRTDSSITQGQPSFFNGSAWTSAGTAVNNGTWQHVAVVVGAGTTSFYINGQLSGSPTQTAPSTNSSIGICMAQRYGDGVPLPGYLDDVRIYNRALSAAEIANQYQWPTGGRP